ncbi:hypothetical protein T08_496 [Trichinella sp. T8]|nr:hypothetical protein T08_496 [Trichinella sp. T8]
MFFLCPTEDDDVVQVDEAGLRDQTSQSALHQALERWQGVAQAEWHNAKLKDPKGRGKRCLFAIILCHFHLPIPGRQVQCAEPLGPCQRIQGIICTRDWLRVDARHRIQLVIIDAESVRAISSAQDYR